MDETLDDLRAKLVAAANHDYLHKLRDTFAAAALTGLLARPTNMLMISSDAAEIAYRMADAMLAARLKKE